MLYEIAEKQNISAERRIVASMASYEIIADNGGKPEVDEIFHEYASAYLKAISLSRRYLYVAIYKNCKLIEEYGPNESLSTVNR